MKRRSLFFRAAHPAVALCVLLCAAPADAADRALLMGVGEYADPKYNLVGIDTDLRNMEVVAERLGFKDIKVLKDAEVTSGTVAQTIEDWLVKGTGPDDRTLIYFSGHGTRIKDENGDEEDKADEVLVLHDFKAEGGKISGVLVDDRIHELLTAIPARETLVFVDACHSGTATKGIVALANRSSGNSEGVSKFIFYPGMPEGGGKDVAVAEKEGAGLRYVALSAASDNEQALATSRGSLFSRALAETFNEGVRKEGEQRKRGMQRVDKGEQGAAQTAQAAKDLTLEQVHRLTTEQIAQYVREDQGISPDKIHHPQLSGNLDLARKALLVRPATQGGGSEWSRFLQFAQAAGGKLNARAVATKLEEGDLLQLEVEIPEAKGYLNVVQVDALDQVTVLFPNQMDRNNEVRQGAEALPGRRNFDWTIHEPYGPALVLVFFTQRKIDLFEQSNGQRDASGKLLEAFPAISSAAARAAVPTQALHAAAFEIGTCETLNQCK
ncbi:MAG: caspase family protein [Gammaproteobacteria bacterium]|nr:caspase family protein [Gammaproteobacteria bacterium]MBU1655490.1 caspase family protein [Gammaproteobacteria bacterium]MBU1962262.1 caspase family protein [Gammaproteobacteria bacterium]